MQEVIINKLQYSSQWTTSVKIEKIRLLEKNRDQHLHGKQNRDQFFTKVQKQFCRKRVVFLINCAGTMG